LSTSVRRPARLGSVLPARWAGGKNWNPVLQQPGLLSKEEHVDGDALGVPDFDPYGIRLRRRDGIPDGWLNCDRIKTWSQGGETYAPIAPRLIQVSPEHIAAIVPKLHGCTRNRRIPLIESPHRDGAKPEVTCLGKEAGGVLAGCAQPDGQKNKKTRLEKLLRRFVL
jgi:hypothetical protein